MPLSLQSDNIFESYNPDIKDSLNTILDSVSELEKIAKEREATSKKANDEANEAREDVIEAREKAEEAKAEATNAQNNVQVAMDTINEVVKITDNAEDQIVDSLKSLTSTISSEPAPVNLQDSILKPPTVDTPTVDTPTVDTPTVDTTTVDTPTVEPEPVTVIDSEPAPVGANTMLTESKPVVPVPVEVEEKEEKLNDILDAVNETNQKLNDYVDSQNLGTNVPEYVIPDGLINDTNVNNIEGFSRFTTPSIILAISFIVLIVLGIVLYYQNTDSIPDFELSDTPFI